MNGISCVLILLLPPRKAPAQRRAEGLWHCAVDWNVDSIEA